VVTIAGVAMTAGVGLLAQTITTVPAIPAPDAPSGAPFKVGSLALAPAVRLTEFGYDSNVFNRDQNNHPVGDFVSTLSPSVNGWFRFADLKVSGHSQADLYYYQSLPSLRSVDSHNAAQVSLGINRVRLFVLGDQENTQRRDNLEIDAIAERDTHILGTGVEVRVSGKTSIGASVQHTSYAYAPNSLYLGTDLGAALNYDSSGETAGMRYAATGLTTFGVDVSHSTARFVTETDRNSEDLMITPVVEFSPVALINGRAAVGYLRRTFSNGTEPFSGANVFIDLGYVLLGRTRFAVTGVRKLEYSYLPGLNDYVQTTIGITVTQRVGDAWDVSGFVGRSTLTYRTKRDGSAVASTPLADETIGSFRVDVGYNLRHIRIGFYGARWRRDSDVAIEDRGYRRLKVGSMMSYVF
jgi:hypothetical protein